MAPSWNFVAPVEYLLTYRQADNHRETDMEGMAMVTARETSILTIATIRTGREKTVEYLFNERQCIFIPAPVSPSASSR